MKNNFNKHFIQLLIIGAVFFLIALLGTSIVPDSSTGFLGQSGEDEGILILLLLPLYLFWIIIEAAIFYIGNLFLVTIPVMSGILIILSAIIARFLFNPNNGHFTGFSILTVLGYTIAKITAVLYSITFSIAFPCGILIALPSLVCFLFFCRNQTYDVSEYASVNKLSHFSKLPYELNTPALLCDTDFKVYSSNSFADRLYKSYDSPQISGRCFCDLLSDEHAQKLRSCAETLRENSSFDRLIVSYTDDNKPDLTVTAVRFKNRKLVGFLIKHE